jgi:hypothetical protein
MAKTSSATRAPRGTKNLARAFFAAADEIPDSQRPEVVKAALALIRDELKAAREKVAAAKAKAKEKAGKASASPVRKPAGITKAAAKTQKKPASGAAEQTMPDEPTETTVQSET